MKPYLSEMQTGTVHTQSDDLLIIKTENKPWSIGDGSLPSQNNPLKLCFNRVSVSKWFMLDIYFFRPHFHLLIFFSKFIGK